MGAGTPVGSVTAWEVRVKLNSNDGAWRVDLPRVATPNAAPPSVPEASAPAPGPADSFKASAPQSRSQLSLQPKVTTPLSPIAEPVAAEPVAAGPSPAAVDPRLSGAKDDQAAFEAANQILDQAFGGGAPKPYGEVFGAAPYVQDGANAEMLRLFGQAIAKAPELAGTPMAEHVKAGQIGQDDVKAMQDFLGKKGFSVGPSGADGLYGPRTHAAISAFLKGDAPGSTGGGSGPAMRQGATGEAVRKMQARLKELGFDPQGADGQFGPNTNGAVKAFQAARGLEADGIVGPKTWDLLGIQVPASELDSAGPAPGASSNDVQQTPDGPMVMRGGKQMRAELAPHWDQMSAAAAQAGITLSLTSGYRSKAHQQRLWDEALVKYGSASAARKWVAPPGTSNHQAGTALDINMGPGVHNWLRANGAKFGFSQPMSWEPWHWERQI